MNALASLGIILLFALLAGHLVKFVRVPEVTGYILAGVVVGPSFLGWISHDNLVTLQVFSEVALGLILFSIGAVFEMSKFRELGRRALLVTVIESVLTAVLVSGGMLVAGQPWPVALLLGAISMETAAATTLMVMRECNAKGALTDTLTGIIAINNILALITFSILAAVIDLTSTGHTLYEAIFPLIWQMVGSLALGYLIGVMLSFWAVQITEHGETLILMSGAVLLCVGFSKWLDLSPLISSLAVGATMVNLSGVSRKLFSALSRTDPPLYAIFFVIAGADLNLSLLASLGVLGMVYVIGRSGGKFFGTRYGARYVGLPVLVQRNLGFAMFSQAGLAIGLVLVINERFPQFGPIVTTIVLASVAIFELFGPLAARFALVNSGEATAQDPAPAVLLD